MDLIEDIEALRKSLGMKKTQIAREFGVIYQNYNNWVSRGSLPKEHYEKANQLLLEHDDPKNNINEINTILLELSDNGREAALQSILSIRALERKYAEDKE